MSELAIQVRALSKRYRIGRTQQRHDTLRDAAVAGLRAPFERHKRSTLRPEAGDNFWALRDVGFDVRRGEVVGVIGRNGAGKTTLLKILSRITEPTAGQVVLNGRAGSLLEVGTGFHPELTGRENIYLNGAILGMRRSEIQRRFDEIVEFAEIESFLDTPVKRYSSGMYVRLAFAVAAHLEPEILLVDEVLAVGDVAFQQKCLGKMESISGEGRTILFVSHNLAVINYLCRRAILLEKGHIVADGSTEAVTRRYLDAARKAPENAFARIEHQGNAQAHIRGLQLRDAAGQLCSELFMGETLLLDLLIEAQKQIPAVDFTVSVVSHALQPVCHFSSRAAGFVQGTPPGNLVARCTVPHLALVAGNYILNVAIYDSLTWECYDRLEGVAALSVLEADVFGSGLPPNPNMGVCFMPADWEIITSERTADR